MSKTEELKSLVKYAKPIVLTHQSIKNQSKIAQNLIDENNENCFNNTEDILNSILPPREYTLDKK